MHHKDPNVAQYACWAVWQLSFGADNKERFSEAGIVDALMDTLQSNIHEKDVLKMVCGAIEILSTSNLKNKESFVAAHALETLSTIKRVNASDAKLVRNTEAAIGVLSGEYMTE